MGDIMELFQYWDKLTSYSIGGIPMSGFFADFFKMIGPPEDIGTSGEFIHYLFNYTTYMNLFYFILVCAGLFGFTYLYHHTKRSKAYYTYGNKKLHLWVTAGIGLAVFASIDLTITAVSNNHLLGHFWNWPDPKEERVVPVEVLAQQWVWHFRHAGSRGDFNSVDDIVSTNELVVPKGSKVVIQMTSKDVIHSLYIPNIRIKVDAIPGRLTRMWFEPQKVGTYDIACAEMCGTHHYLMGAKLKVMEPEDYENWKKEARKISLATNDLENPDSFWGWKWEIE